MPNALERLNVSRIVNAKGPSTRLSGGPMRPEVAAAMVEAAGSCVDILELQAAASQRIAAATGAESGLVTSGAAAGLLLATAACIARLDPAAMARLPDTRSLRREVVVARSQRNQYDHALRAAGAVLVEVGLPDRIAGAGVRDAEAWEFEAAIGDATAAVLWVAGTNARPSLEEVVAVAHAHDVPVIVDAAAQLPPRRNLRCFVEQGADLVAFSGGKALGGPQASGILCGRRDLVASAALQMLDMDYPSGRFLSPASFIDRSALRGLPPHGIGRPCKVGKEQIVGLLTALDLFLAGDDAADRQRWLQRLGEVVEAIGMRPGITEAIDEGATVPRLALEIEPAIVGRSAVELYAALADGRPRIETDPAELDQGRLIFGPLCLVDGDATLIGARFRELLG